MTKPKVSTIKRGGSRFYVHPQTHEKVPGVTSVINMLPKPWLRYWAAKLVAEEAVRDVQALSTLVEYNSEGAVDYLKRAPDRVIRKAARTGSAAHEVFEQMALGHEPDYTALDAELEPFARHFNEFLQAAQPEFMHLEETVWSESEEYAGSFDAIATIGGETVFLDWKTTRSGIHPEVGIQLAAYRNAEYILTQDGSREVLPAAVGGAVVHVRPEGWQLVPVACGHAQFDTFLALLDIFDYDREDKRQVVGLPIAGSEHIMAKVTNTRKKAV